MQSARLPFSILNVIVVLMKTMEERLMSKVVKDKGCWLWCGAVFNTGYGMIAVGPKGSRKVKMAHRVSYETFVGPIPDGYVLHHRCERIRCIKPKHLEPMTRGDNVRIGNYKRWHG